MMGRIARGQGDGHTREERQVVEDGMRQYASVPDYKIDVRGNAIEIHIAH